MTEEQLSEAAEKLADRIRTLPAGDPLLRRLEAGSVEFLRGKGFDVGTRGGCLAALAWLEEARVEDAYWSEALSGEQEEIRCAADWYIGEARIEGMRRILERRLREYFP